MAGKGQPPQTAGAQTEAEDATDDTGRQKELLHRTQLGARDLASQQQQRRQPEIDEEGPGGEFHSGSESTHGAHSRQWGRANRR